MLTPREPKGKTRNAKSSTPISYRLLGTVLGFMVLVCFGVYLAGTRLSKRITVGDRMFLGGSALFTLSLYALSRQESKS